MSVGGAPDVPGHPEFAYRCDLYTRYRLINPATPFFAQVLLIDSDQCTLGVDVDGVALGVDFRTESTRPDVPGRQRERPGIRIAERLAEARDNGHRSVLVNGNNVGYWGNQFAFRDGNLVYKERGPIFDDGELAAHATGEYPFFYGSQDGFFFRKVRLSSTTVGLDTVVTSPDPESTPPPAGLSGYPLVWGGKPVWSRTEHLDMVWDPQLVFEVGRLVGVAAASSPRRRACSAVRPRPHAATLTRPPVPARCRNVQGAPMLSSSGCGSTWRTLITSKGDMKPGRDPRHCPSQRRGSCPLSQDGGGAMDFLRRAGDMRAIRETSCARPAAARTRTRPPRGDLARRTARRGTRSGCAAGSGGGPARPVSTRTTCTKRCG